MATTYNFNEEETKTARGDTVVYTDSTVFLIYQPVRNILSESVGSKNGPYL